MSRNELETKLQDLIKRYYNETDWDEKADRFFTIVEVYNHLKAQGYESHSMMVMANIIVIG